MLPTDVIGTNTGQNFEPDLSMTVPRPYEANLGPKNAIFDFSKFAKNIFGRKFVSAGSRPDSRRSREFNRRPGRPGEGQMRAI